MSNTSDKFLKMMLEGYENNVEGINQYLENTTK